eukprot:GFKZ01003130.1.p1 GENE.GFKZ01003130.1~~GFKZ01003130.1.p1  ORF type:complete len:665 (-),score=34.78 GFKZ01003130.1:1545-3539(-)
MTVVKKRQARLCICAACAGGGSNFAAGISSPRSTAGQVSHRFLFHTVKNHRVIRTAPHALCPHTRHRPPQAPLPPSQRVHPPAIPFHPLPPFPPSRRVVSSLLPSPTPTAEQTVITSIHANRPLPRQPSPRSPPLCRPQTRMSSGRVRLARVLLLLLLTLTPALSNSLVSGDVNCTIVPSPPPDSCLPNLAREPALYETCRETICYLFLQEAPFITLNATAFSIPDRDLQVPFPCASPSALHPSLSGLAFHLHARTSSAMQSCIWAGPISQCSFNRLVNFTAAAARQGYQFAITGLLLETPSRQCHHIPSAPFIDNSMVIIGRTDPDNPTVRSPLYQLLRPFRWSTWGIFAAFTLLFLIVSLTIALRVRVARRRSLVTAFFIFAGERDQAVAHERELRRNSKRPAPPPAPPRSWRVRWRPGRRRRKQSRLTSTTTTTVTTAPSLSFPSEETPRARRLLPLRLQQLHQKRQQEQMQEEEGKVMALASKYGLSMTLFRISLLAFLGVFALFYEVAVVNFVFQQSRVELGKSVRNLSSRELAKYAVLRNSALENVWSAAGTLVVQGAGALPDPLGSRPGPSTARLQGFWPRETILTLSMPFCLCSLSACAFFDTCRLARAVRCANCPRIRAGGSARWDGAAWKHICSLDVVPFSSLARWILLCVGWL